MATPWRSVGWGEHHPVGRTSCADADQGPHDGAAQHLVVVAVHDVGLRRQIRDGEQRQERAEQVVGRAHAGWIRQPVGSVRSGGSRSATRRRRGRPSWRNSGVELQHQLAPVTHEQHPVAGEHPEVGQLDAVLLAAGRQLVEPGRRHGHHHPLLGLGEPQLPRGEARVLDGQPANSTSAPMPSAISPTALDSPPAPQSVMAERQVHGLHEHVDHQLLGDRVADLHAGARHLAGSGIHGGGRERGAAEAVTAGAAPEHDHPITRVWPVEHRGVEGASPMHPQNTEGLAV
jgi:hypothetical protein